MKTIFTGALAALCILLAADNTYAEGWHGRGWYVQDPGMMGFNLWVGPFKTRAQCEAHPKSKGKGFECAYYDRP
jgi:hypothetical protein